MATSGSFESWKLTYGSLTVNGEERSTAGAYYYFSWSSSEKSNGITTVSWELWGKGRSSSPTKLNNSIDLTYGSTTLYTLRGGSSDAETKFNNYKRASGSFDVTHAADGSASFKIGMNVSIWDTPNNPCHYTEETFTLNSNRHSYQVSITNAAGATSSGADWYRGGSSVSVSGGANDGYTWSGWTGYATTTANPYTFTMPDSNVELTSNATLNTYTISYNLASDKAGWPAVANHPSTYHVTTNTFTVTDPQRPGYSFAGWTGTGLSSATKSLSITKGSTGNRSYTATWNPNKYTINYDGNGATGGSTAASEHTFDSWKALSANGFVRSYTVTYKKDASTTDKTLIAEYGFSGWKDAGGTSYTNQQSVSNLLYSGSMTLYAQWNPASVSYSPTKTGYTFSGWNTAADGTGTNYPASFTPESNLTLYPRWSQNSQTVYFDSNGGVTASPTNKSVTYDNSYGTLATTSRTGYAFEGWFTSRTGGAQITAATTVKITSEQTLYAQWKPIQKTVTFNSNGGVAANPTKKTVTYDDTYGTLAETSRDGYDFAGWFTSKTGGEQITEDITVQITANQTLYAHWVASKGTVYTVEHWQQKLGVTDAPTINNCNKVVTETLKGTTDELTSATARSYAGFTPLEIEQVNINGDGSAIVRVFYTRNFYSISLEKTVGVNNVTTIKESYQYGELVTLSATTLDGYTWSGWRCNLSNYTSTENPYSFNIPARDITFVAEASADTDTQYTVKHCRISLAGGYPSDLTEVEILKGTTASLTNAVPKTYTGFYSKAFEQKQIAGNGSTVVTITYARNSYDVTLKAGTGVASVTGNATYKYEEPVTVEAIMETGYTWSRWSGSMSSSDQSFTFTMPASDVSLTANSTANGYTVTYVGQNGKQVTSAPNPGSNTSISDSVTFNTFYTIRSESNAFTRTGYKFLGWATSAGSKVISSWTPDSSIKWTLTDDLVLYAVWKSKGVLYVDTGSEFVPYTIWIDSGSSTGGPNNNGWYQYTAWLDTGDTSLGTNGWVQLGSLPD